MDISIKEVKFLIYARIIKILICICFIVSCDNDEVSKDKCGVISDNSTLKIECELFSDFDYINSNIQGTWTWVQEKRISKDQAAGFATPEHQCYSRKLEISGDVVKYYKDNTLESTYKYSINFLGEFESIPGYDFPEWKWIVFTLLDPDTGLRQSYVPISLCDKYLVLYLEFRSEKIGQEIWIR